ncbi:hypothetical protein [Amycolatopsis plumensis]|uniref:Uncharacterized protein n=1 Tax=Amycolatopsis plumensis TaxID=236508 RepID=A0ABV5U8E8_9PSEU
MITTHLTAVQLEQLEALLADTTPGGVAYRPPVARDESTLTNLEGLGLVRWTEDCGFEITDAGREAVVERVRDAADAEAFLFDADADLLQDTIEKLKAAFPTLPAELRDRALMDIEVCQDVLDSRRAAAEDQTAESTGRHRAVPADDRPTETIARVDLPTEPLALGGTLPEIPVAKILTDREGAERLLAAIEDMPSPDDVAEYLAEPHTADEWADLEADLADEPGWLRRNLTPPRVLALSVLAAVVSTWFVAWLVMG